MNYAPFLQCKRNMFFQIMKEKKNMGLKERRKKIMTLMLAACVAGTSVVPVAASDVSVFSDGTDASPEAFDSADVDSANVAAQKTIYINSYPFQLQQ